MSQRGQGMHIMTGIRTAHASDRQGLGTEPHRGGQTGGRLTWGLVQRVEQGGGAEAEGGTGVGVGKWA